MNRFNRSGLWLWGVGAVSSLLVAPVVLIFASLAAPQLDIWRHLIDTVLVDYISNSLVLAFGVGALVIAIGAPMAWAVARYEFWGRKHIQWLALLPMAMPAYIIAYSYTGLLDFAGPVQSQLRSTFDWQYGDYYFPEIRSLGGAVLMLALVLYPYVYMLAKTAFAELPANMEETAKSLGASERTFFSRVALPIARPAILMGAALAMMEAFADYGTVQYFGISTFTTGVFRTWFGLGNGIAAAQLSALLTTFVMLLLILEFYSRRKVRYYAQGQKRAPRQRSQLPMGKGVAVALLCLLPIVFGFVIPLAQLVYWAITIASAQFDQAFWRLVWNSFYLAAITAMTVVGLAILFAYAKRLNSSRFIHSTIRAVGLGYALPGTVIAIGAMLILTQLDIYLNELTEAVFDTTVGLVLSGSLFALVLVYSIRFLAVAMHNLDTGMARIKPSLDEAAQSFGFSPLRIVRSIHIPLLQTSVLSALLLVFVDVLKELPATLILRPFNFNTLAVRTFELASDERLIEAATPAIAIVAVGIIPVVVLSRMTDKAAA